MSPLTETCERNVETVEIDDHVPSYRPLHEAPLRRWYLPVKAVIEWCMALVLFLIASPIICALAAMVRITSPGPAFYTQMRVGRLGRCFRMVKLRSMSHGCEATTGPVWSGPDDARVTPIGRFLRETHLDELPQLLNVLRGDMSLVGPRPERPELIPKIERAIPRYRERLRVRPGVTGLAQMHLPPDTNLDGVRRKLEYDLYYVREVSFAVDTRVGLCTVFHFIAAVVDGLGKLLLRSYSNAVERNFHTPTEQKDDRRRSTAAAHSLHGV